jgi:hypothetical protein
MIKAIGTMVFLYGCFMVGITVMGSLGIGEFRLYYGPNKPPIEWCQK